MYMPPPQKAGEGVENVTRLQKTISPLIYEVKNSSAGHP